MRLGMYSPRKCELEPKTNEYSIFSGGGGGFRGRGGAAGGGNYLFLIHYDGMFPLKRYFKSQFIPILQEMRLSIEVNSIHET